MINRLSSILLCFSLMASALFLPLAAAHAASAEPSTPGLHQTAPVIVDGQVLFQVRGVSAFPASERASAIRQRILTLAEDPNFKVEQLTVEETEDRSVIRGGSVDVINVLDADAELESLDRKVLAGVYAQVISRAIEEYRASRSTGNLLRNAAFAIGATVLVALLIAGVLRLFRWIDGWATRHVQKSLEGLADKSHHLLHAGQLWRLFSGFVRLLRITILLVLAYFYLNTVLGLFPWTRPAARMLIRLVLDPLASLWSGFVAAIPNLIFLVVLFFVFRYLLRLVRAFFVSVERGKISLENFDNDWAMPTYKIVRVLMIAFAVVIAYPYIPGSDSMAFKGVSVFLGVLLSLGSSSFIANMIAGMAMTYRRAFREGEIVRIDDTVGIVEDIKLMVTRIRTPKNESVVIPNSHILNTAVINYSEYAREGGLVLHTTVGIGYDTPWRQVEAMLLLAAERTPGFKKEPPPFVLQTSLGDFAVQYQLNVFSDKVDRIPALYSRLHAQIQDVFNEHGVQIMSPAYERDPDQPKVVPPDEWYAAPARKPES